MVIGIYIRVSTVNQQDNESLELQRRKGEDFCKINHFEYKVYSDVASGRLLGSERGGFRELEKDLRGGEIDGVWIYDWDRAMREQLVGITFRDLILSTNAKLFVGGVEKDLSSDAGMLEFGIGNVFSDYWIRKLTQVMKSGKEAKWEKGEGWSGKVGLGYRKNDKGELEIFDEEEVIVKDIFDMFLYKSVKSYEELWRRIKNKYGKVYGIASSSRIRTILSDEKYKGIYTVKTKAGKEYTFRIGRIIDDYTFDLVQMKKKSIVRSRIGNTVKNYLLKGKVDCADCGESMWVRGGGKEEGALDYYRYYSCKSKMQIKRDKKYDNQKERDLCESHLTKDNRISIDRLEFVVWRSLKQILKESDSIKKEYEKRFLSDKGLKKEVIGKLAYFENQEKKWKEDKSKLITKILNGEYSKEDYDEWIERQYEVAMKKIEKRILSYRNEVSKIEGVEKFESYLDLMNDDLNLKFNTKDFHSKKRILKQYVDKVYVKRNGVEDSHYIIGIKLHLGDSNEGLVEVGEEGFTIYKLKGGSSVIPFLVYNYFELFIMVEISTFGIGIVEFDSMSFGFNKRDLRDFFKKRMVDGF